ncbi:MAG: M23 family metallopeptidase [Deltaproteobacteria bacterium]|nr:M23 family metallopeptidase [Deltaproteobacteria bacterium]
MKNKPILGRYIICMSLAVLFGQLFLPSIGQGNIGSGTSQAGKNLVKQRTSRNPTPLRSGKPIKKVLTIQQGDTLVEILAKAGASKKDALLVARKADRVFSLKKMRPGTELELYFASDRASLQELDYKVSSREKVVLYKGRAISLAGSGRALPAVQAKNLPGDRNRGANVSPRGTLRCSATERNVHGAPDSRPEKAGKPCNTPRVLSVPPAADLTANMDDFPRDSLIPVRASSLESPVHASKGSSLHMKLVTTSGSLLPGSGLPPAKSPSELLADGVVYAPITVPWKNASAAVLTQRQAKVHKKHSVAAKLFASAKKKRAHADKGPKDLARLKQYKDESSLQAFLKVPLHYKRVSSGFTHSRLDPITNAQRPHLGVDYAAPIGTPVHSIGPGRVVFIGWDGGYGKTIRIRHTNGYISHYAHLSRFPGNMKKGKRVRRGEVIGYVGMTGFSTGPHLDFRVTREGKYLNPERLHLQDQQVFR